MADLIFGDPRGYPHPTRLIGKYAEFIEPFARGAIQSRLVAGFCFWLIVVVTTGALTYAITAFARNVGWVSEFVVTALFIYFSVALRDLADHGLAVHDALAQGKLDLARKRLSLMVGRDTANLDEEGITRACVESVSEGMVDGVTSPLFYAVIFGPVGAMVYRAINTLDSMYGYKNEKNLLFGRASAKLDDVANFIPARVTAPFVWLGALLSGMNATGSRKATFRYGNAHDSPNSAISEAAVAGALGVRLGGPARYRGESVDRPYIGDDYSTLNRGSILQSVHLVNFASILYVSFLIIVKVILIYLFFPIM